MAATSLTLRPMTTGDLEACAAMIDATPLFARYDLDASAARRLLARALEPPTAAADDLTRVDLTLAERDASAVGFSWFVPRGAFDRSGYLRLIVIDPRAQGQGVGQALLARLEQRFGGSGGIVLLASEHNSGAHRFYERRGYLHVGTLPGYVKPGMNERIYFKATAAKLDQEGR
jgi:ribosomal protein S18 acetylase RimI-like enzyme